MPRRKTVYLAGPEVFLSDAVAVGEAKKAICARHGLTGLFPLDNELDLGGLDPQDAGRAISAANEALMRRADLIIANITPFRGPGMDPGTAFEIGFMRALGRPVFCYTASDLLHAERAVRWAGPAVQERKGEGLEDGDGLLIESFGMVENLMIDGAVEASGGIIVTPETAADPQLDLRDLTLFEACVRTAAAHVGAKASHGVRDAAG
ncbi:putative Nucleoside 2-deoxyribosyltransferase [Caenispirillum salinarum AK4]|uniref:Putative Nucleoside 2-deoxyribosyltransferase n=1 Tax=Caenispirillum salinarum AK4 TaxID=1238182 RepID=K9H4F8_9PROT|nr:nucleoside 2-deoxyribosyltransferase [Caenispirillum salinarum]EKV32457.1 putative Nucleoside 2-deoxyribosyltransferase [Caenispirillum salinarum AK4]